MGLPSLAQLSYTGTEENLGKIGLGIAQRFRKVSVLYPQVQESFNPFSPFFNSISNRVSLMKALHIENLVKNNKVILKVWRAECVHQ